ncbi:MAG: hypothetical protein JL50_20085 [Peptococcaceae bacterium BICA1-7]|nr:MAG: hypothetical protein JL50_20085 [Peptococcaceae bacterium BICA1-7]HBV98381.1 peptidase M19 [Desulfotomaculum sp.]
MINGKELHEKAILIDATCPLATIEKYLQNYREGGATVIAATVGFGIPQIGTLQFTMHNLGQWFDRFRNNPDKLLLVTSVEDIYRAKRENKLGVIFHFQASLPFEDNINNIEIYYRLGVRVCQLCYNTKDLVGCGCAEDTDTGLTPFGEKVIAELNRLGAVVDCAHTGYRTTMEAIEASRAPVIISHGNARALCDTRRNLPEDIIKAIAKNGGVVGINGYPAFVANKARPTLDDYLNHIDYMAKLVGVEHICIGMDYYEYQAGVMDDDTAKMTYDFLISSGAWKPEEYPSPPWHYPEGIEMPEKLCNLTTGLLKRGYSKKDVEKILGLNIIRVFREVWK